MNEKHTLTADVAIIGASLSGAALALALGKQGFRISLFDKADSFPREKCCGEGLSALGLSALADLGLAEEIAKLPHYPFEGYVFWRGKEEARLRLDSRSPYSSSCASSYSSSYSSLFQQAGVGIERFYLDACLHQALAREDSVSCSYQTKVTSVTSHSDGYLIQTNQQPVKARYLVLADGAYSLNAARLKIPNRKLSKVRSGASIHFTGTFSKPINSVHILKRIDHEVCVTVVDQKRINIAILGQPGCQRILLDKDSLQKLQEEIYQKISFTGEQSSDVLSVGPIGQYVRRGAHYRSLLIGDACEQLDPIGGMGMSHALLSASLATEALSLALHDSTHQERAFRQYEIKRATLIRPLRGFTRLAYLSLVKLPTRMVPAPILNSSLARATGRAAHGLQPQSILIATLLNLLGG